MNVNIKYFEFRNLGMNRKRSIADVLAKRCARSKDCKTKTKKQKNVSRKTKNKNIMLMIKKSKMIKKRPPGYRSKPRAALPAATC